MCISAQPARFSNTIVYAAEVLRDKKPVHVIGYQNQVTKSSGPNALILPIPAKGALGPENIVTSGLKHTLTAYRDAVVSMKPAFRGFFKSKDTLLSMSPDSRSFQVFNSGAYTVALANDAKSLTAALAQVPIEKRPELRPELIEGLAQAYPEWPIAICCFNSADFNGATPDPVFWWYEPQNPNELFAPAIDAHDGGAPQKRKVPRDHTVIFGSVFTEHHRNGGGVRSRLASVPSESQWLLTQGIMGSLIQERHTKNGDFVLPLSIIHNSARVSYLGVDQVPVKAPPGWS